jgi:glycosyltransferase involved in cell wall biosynthesis
MNGRIDQVLDIVAFGDAISNEARAIQTHLREHGFASSIFARVIGSDLPFAVDEFRVEALSGADAVIYHYATGSAVGHAVAALPLPSLLIYHNITPARFFAPYDAAIADVLERGSAELPAVAAGFTTLVADSAFSASELAARTGRSAGVVPIARDYERFDAIGAAREPRSSGGASEWLAVGRIAPNKGLLRLVAVFAEALAWSPDAHLTIAGSYRPTDAFHLALRAEIALLGIGNRVTLTGSISEADLLACYAAADVYVTLSEHEGFCVPLVEAMACGLPIVASTSTAIPETLGAAGIMVDDDASPREIAALVHLVLTDTRLQHAVVAAGRERRTTFAPGALGVALDRALDDLIQPRSNKESS